MHIVPVIDLKDGVVVHAMQGNREAYQAVHRHSCISNTSEIDAVLNDFLSLYPFDTVYIADLNAITSKGNHEHLISQVVHAYPKINFWIDNGCQLSAIAPQKSIRPVIGTESQVLPPSDSAHDYILSLDFQHQHALGHSAWFQHSQFWPRSIIAMSLNRVGSHCGPDVEKLSQLRQNHPDKHWIAAGGIRHMGDLVHLEQAGIKTALVATALHSGALNQEALQDLNRAGNL